MTHKMLAGLNAEAMKTKARRDIFGKLALVRKSKSLILRQKKQSQALNSFPHIGNAVPRRAHFQATFPMFQVDVSQRQVWRHLSCGACIGAGQYNLLGLPWGWVKDARRDQQANSRRQHVRNGVLSLQRQATRRDRGLRERLVRKRDEITSEETARPVLRVQRMCLSSRNTSDFDPE